MEHLTLIEDWDCLKKKLKHKTIVMGLGSVIIPVKKGENGKYCRPLYTHLIREPFIPLEKKKKAKK